MTWESLINIYASTGKPVTQQRKANEFKHSRWDRLRKLEVDQTTGADFLDLMHQGGQMTQIYLSAIQQLALDIGARTHVVLPRKMWPKIHKVTKRAITENEHRMLCSNMQSRSWKTFLQILWETGAAQSDAASFRIEKLAGDILEYNRMKTGRRAAQRISKQLQRMLASVAAQRTQGYFLPMLERTCAKDRASMFRRACIRCNITGVTLHSYRYAWAERAFSEGMPERLAMIALGHNSAAIHRTYAKGANVVAPCLNDCQNVEEN